MPKIFIFCVELNTQTKYLTINTIHFKIFPSKHVEQKVEEGRGLCAYPPFQAKTKNHMVQRVHMWCTCKVKSLKKNESVGVKETKIGWISFNVDFVITFKTL